MADWLSLVLPPSAALASAALTQWWSARQTGARTAAEDRARSWEHRREAYVTFRRALLHLYDHRAGVLAYGGPIEEHYKAVSNCLNDVAFFGSGEVLELASTALEATFRPGQDLRASMDALDAFVKLARRDLQVPD